MFYSDEATFSLDGHVNWQNTRYWSDETPHWMQAYHTLRQQKINGCAGIVKKTNIDSYFFDAVSGFLAK